MKITKERVLSAVFGAVLCALIYLSYVFYQAIGTAYTANTTANSAVAWICNKEPVSCGKQAPAPAQAQSNVPPSDTTKK